MVEPTHDSGQKRQLRVLTDNGVDVGWNHHYSGRRNSDPGEFAVRNWDFSSDDAKKTIFLSGWYTESVLFDVQARAFQRKEALSLPEPSTFPKKYDSNFGYTSGQSSSTSVGASAGFQGGSPAGSVSLSYSSTQSDQVSTSGADFLCQGLDPPRDATQVASFMCQLWHVEKTYEMSPDIKAKWRPVNYLNGNQIGCQPGGAFMSAFHPIELFWHQGPQKWLNVVKHDWWSQHFGFRKLPSTATGRYSKMKTETQYVVPSKADEVEVNFELTHQVRNIASSYAYGVYTQQRNLKSMASVRLVWDQSLEGDHIMSLPDGWQFLDD